jgi:hypothetical protein
MVMEKKMTTQNYFVVEADVVTNNVVWDGDTNTWQPPVGATMLIQADTQALIWTPVVIDKKVIDWILTETLGAGDIGFTWNETTQVLTTNQPKPTIPD